MKRVLGSNGSIPNLNLKRIIMLCENRFRWNGKKVQRGEEREKKAKKERNPCENERSNSPILFSVFPWSSPADHSHKRTSFLISFPFRRGR